MKAITVEIMARNLEIANEWRLKLADKSRHTSISMKATSEEGEPITIHKIEFHFTEEGSVTIYFYGRTDSALRPASVFRIHQLECHSVK